MSEPAEQEHSGVRHPVPQPSLESSCDGTRGERGDGRAEQTPGADTERRTRAPSHCGWCGRCLEPGSTAGRKRRYCGQACRQRAYERRAVVRRGGLPADAVVLAAGEIAALQDRLFQLRCAAEDVVTAVDEGAPPADLRRMADTVARSARDLERLR